MKTTTFQNSNKGFAMLFTVLIVTLILSIALGISNITYKQTVLSSLAKDSEIAMYQADAGIECALYYDLNVNLQSFNGINTPPNPLLCGNQSIPLYQSSAGFYEYKVTNPSSSACISDITIDKTLTSNPNQYVLKALGNNICQSNLRQVERALEVRYTP